MAKRKRFSKVRRYGRRLFPRRKAKRQMRLLPTLGFVTHVFTPPNAGESSTPWDHLQRGDFQQFARMELSGWLGGDPLNGQWNLAQMLNPLDFNNARYLKTMIWTSLASAVIGRFVPQVNRNLGAIPYLGKYLRL